MAHDNKKLDLVEWARANRGTLSQTLSVRAGRTFPGRGLPGPTCQMPEDLSQTAGQVEHFLQRPAMAKWWGSMEKP